jgi:hypothetical protein
MALMHEPAIATSNVTGVYSDSSLRATGQHTSAYEVVARMKGGNRILYCLTPVAQRMPARRMHGVQDIDAPRMGRIMRRN